MASVFYKELITNIADVQTIEQDISTKAQDICARRETYADYLEHELAEMKERQVKANSVLDDMVSSAISIDDAAKDSIVTQCKSIKDDLSSHIDSLEKLCYRFRNKRIRIVSFGPKTQGKSVFTRLYTGLPDEIVAVKPDGNDIDKTGAINVIKHDSTRTSPKIVVYFKTKDEVVKQINDYVSLLPRELNIRPFSTFHDVEVAKRNNSIIQKLADFHGAIMASCKAGLESFFGENKSISEAGSEPKEIPVDRICIYNDMQYDGPEKQRYAVVEHIDILTNLGRDYFKYFEIGDTKGSSTDAGGNLADQEIFNAIDNSDAAFSITRVGSGQNGGQYITGNLFNHYQNDISSLHDKLFVIINMEKEPMNRGQQLINTVVGNIESQKMSEQIYIGCFYERPIEIDFNDAEIQSLEKINPNIFVKAVLLDMLKKIVDNTKRNDDKLIDKINKSSVIINTKIQNLKSLLCGITTLKEESEDGLILDVIRSLRDNTYNQLNSSNGVEDDNHTIPAGLAQRRGFNYGQEQQPTQTEVNDNPYAVEQPDLIDYEAQYKKLRNNKYSIFKLLTGDDRNLHGKENQSVKEEIEESVRYIYTKNGQTRPCVVDVITDTIVSRPSGDTSDSGRFIECVSMMFSNRIKDNFNKKLIPQNEILFKDEANELYKSLWDGLKFNCFIGWGEYSLENLSERSVLNDQLKALYDLYKDEYEDTTDPISLFTPYDTLHEYFRRVFDKEKRQTKHTETDIVIDDEILIKTIVDLIRVHNIPKMIVDKVTDKTRRVNNLRIQIVQEIAPQTSFVQRMLPLYRLPEANPVFSEELRQRRDYNAKIHKFNSSKDSVLAMTGIANLSINL